MFCPLALADEESTIGYSKERMKTADYKARGGMKGGRDWVIQRKERHLRKGKDLKHQVNTKYTGRKRRPKF